VPERKLSTYSAAMPSMPMDSTTIATIASTSEKPFCDMIAIFTGSSRH